MDPLLYGHNTDERIVAVQQLNDQTIRLYKRVEGKVLHQDAEFFPFFFLADKSLIDGFPKKFWLKELAGSNFYRYIAVFTRWSEMWEAVHFILLQYNKIRSPRASSYQDIKEILVRADAVRQFLLQSGKTLFKGMMFDELVGLHVDVQFAPVPGKRQGGETSEERILAITIATSEGTELTFSTHKQNERVVLEKCIQRINTIDPDIIEGYDLFGTILPALNRACERQNIPFAVGRGGSDMRAPSGFGTIGIGESEWFSFDVFGRHLIDLLKLAEIEIDAKETEQSFTLHSLAKHFGIPVGIDPIIKQQGIANEWSRDPKNITDQSLRNIQIVRSLYNLLSPPLFYLAKMCPFNYRMLMQLSGASRIEALMLREYVRQKYSIPKSHETSRSINIPSEVFKVGVFTNVLYIELEGLHSSIILNKNIKPKTDELNIFLSLLSKLSLLKKEMISDENTDRSLQDSTAAQSNALKYLIDSFHTYLGSARGLFNDPDNAEDVLTSSRDILKDIIHQIEIFNATIIQSDSQGFFLIPPDNIVGETNEINFVARLSSNLPNGINLALSHSYKGMFSYRKNNYALMDQKENILIKGNGLITRSMEQYLRVFIQHFVECLLTNDFKRMHHTFATAYTQILQHKWTPADFCRTDLVKTDTETYQAEIKEGRIVSTPAMEAAIRSSQFTKANTKISYYISGSEANANASHFSRLIEEWDSNLADENTAYYMAKLHEAANKFREFFEPTAFERICSMDEIFGFSDERIQILSRKPAPEALGAKSDPNDYSIWLAESD